MVLSGFLPNHFFEIYSPAAMKAKLTPAKISPHVCTDTSKSPYGSMRAINTPPRKLLKVVKKMRANNPGISLMIANVCLMLSFLESGDSDSVGVLFCKSAF